MRSRFPQGLVIIDDQLATILARKTMTERIAMADGLWRSARKVVQAMLRREHPEWTEEEIRREVARRMSYEAGWPEDLKRGYINADSICSIVDADRELTDGAQPEGTPDRLHAQGREFNRDLGLSRLPLASGLQERPIPCS
jgi:hypothetical protein